MAKVTGDSQALRTLAKILKNIIHNIINENRKNHALLNHLCQTAKDQSIQKAEQIVNDINIFTLKGLDDIRITYKMLLQYAEFLSSLEEAAPGLKAGKDISSKKDTTEQNSEQTLSPQEKRDWICSVVPGCIAEEAASIVNSMETYSDDGFVRIHWDKDGKEIETQDILKVFDSGNVPVYKGIMYRGLHFESKEIILEIIKKNHGNWIEPGITSFSKDFNVSKEKYAAHEKDQWGVVFTCRNNKTAIPFWHMSLKPDECEVLSPGGHRNHGWKIDMNSLVIDNKNHMIYADIYEK